MVASMTGYGRSEKALNDYRVVVEISTLNNRYLDFQMRLPRSLFDLEQRVKKLLSSKISRGKVNFSLMVEDNVQAYERLSLNAGLADMYYNILNDLRQRFKLPDQISLGSFTNLPDLITTETTEIDLEKIWSDIEPVCREALDNLYKMRLAEGQNLFGDFQNRLTLLAGHVLNIKQIADRNATAHREKLKQRIQEILADQPIDEQRIAMEAALFAEKMDITEEVIRLDSHIESFRQTLDEGGAVGKRINFILQEMHREANTISSKAASYEISALVINIKDELEKLREQAFNIE
jgi:uncharacterized protein (TIGR00255 family)